MKTFFLFFPVHRSIYYSDRPYPDPYIAAASGIGPVAGYGVSATAVPLSGPGLFGCAALVFLKSDCMGAVGHLWWLRHVHPFVVLKFIVQHSYEYISLMIN